MVERIAELKDRLHVLAKGLLPVALFIATLLAANNASATTVSEALGSIRELSFPAISAENNILQNTIDAPTNALPTTTTDEVKRIEALDALVKSQNRTVDLIDAASVMDLPVGIVKNVGALQYTIIVSKMTTTPDKDTYLEVVMSFEVPQTGKKLAFIARQVHFTNKGGIIGEPKLELLGDQKIPLGTDKISLVLKGAELTKEAGAPTTSVTFDCHGYKQMQLAADVEFSPTVFVPENIDGSLKVNETLKSSFTATTQDFNDLVINLAIAPFQLKGLTGFGFTVNRAIFDFSDLQNGAGIVFPKNYLSTYLGAGISPNLWRGICIQDASIKLPKEFKLKSTQTNRITLTASNLIIDEHGFTGLFGVPNLIPSKQGDMNGWDFSIDNFSVSLEASQIKAAGFSGFLNVPILGDNSALTYAALISTGGNYNFTVSPKENVELPLWAANATILNTSTITIAAVEGKFKPVANLNGSLSITKGSDDPSQPDKNTILDIGTLNFEHLVVKSEAPYLSVGTVAYASANSSSNKLGAFPLTMSGIGIKTEGDKVGITFTATVNFMGSSDEGFGGTGSFIVWGEHELISNKYKYKHVEVTALGVSVVKEGAYSIIGSVQFFRGDPTYGKGFRGSIEAIFGSKIKITATAIFGGVDDYRYWYVDGMFTGVPIPVCPALAICGFGGGVYHHMKQQGYNETAGSSLGASSSGIIYVPTPLVALGLKASVAVATTGSQEVLNGDATFGISFYASGGLAQVSFEGNVYLVTSSYLSAATDVVKSTKSLAGGIATPAPSPDAARAQIAGNMSLLYDKFNDSFHGTLNIYVNVAGGIVRGIGDNNRAGWLVLHFAPHEWYVYIGTPTDPCGIKLANIFETRSYFMAGTSIPGSPPPPKEVTDILGPKDYDYMRELNSLGNGSGLAFGASLAINTGEINFLVFYAQLKAGVGFDIMLKKYDAECVGRSGNIGINKWYANGQTYIYVEGSVGINVDLVFYKGKYEIIHVGLAALLQAKGPNPFWMKGAVAGNYNILNGLVKGSCNFEYVLGEECILRNANPLGGIKIISQVTPATGSTDIDAFSTPQALFNVAVNKDFVIIDDQSKSRTFRVKLDDFTLIAPNNSPIAGNIAWNSNQDVAAFNTIDVLPSKTLIKATVKVSFEELIGNTWSVVYASGQKVIETMENTFTSGLAPDYIPLSNIAYSYPILNQYNFYKSEYNQGYVKLIKGQPDLFTAPTGFTQKGRMKTVAGTTTLFDVTYANLMVAYTLPTNITNSAIYSFDIVNIPTQTAQAIDRNVTNESVTTGSKGVDQSNAEVTTKKAEGSIETLQEKSILTYYFRTSKYNTFVAKINAMTVSDGWSWPLAINVHELGLTLSGDEMFDMMETHWNATIVPVVQFQAAFAETSWFTQKVNPLTYQNYPLTVATTISWRDVSILGVPPVKAGYINQYPNDRMVTESDISGLSAVGTPNVAAFMYSTNYYTDQDFYDIRSKVAVAYATNTSATTQVANILATSTSPGFIFGDYPMDVKYVLPGLNTVTSTKRIVFKYPVM